MNCTLHFFHRDIREGNSYVDWHSHPMFEIVYYRTGQGLTSFEGQEHRYGPGSFAVLLPNVPHDETRQTETEVIYFGFYYANQPVRLESGFYQDREGAVGVLLDQVLGEIADKKNHYELKLAALLQSLIIEVQRISGSAAMKQEYIQIEYAKHYMDQYFNQKIRLTTLAELCGYSYDHFRHLFKAAIGVTPMHYLRQIRIEKSKQMILEDNRNLTFIAQECGFSSLSQFSRIFRQETGLNPTGYKLSCINAKLIK